MAGMVGAEVEALLSLADSFAASAQRLSDVNDRLSAVLKGATWEGERADAARSQWFSSSAPMLMAARRLLLDCEESLRRNALEQSAASAATSTLTEPGLDGSRPPADPGQVPTGGREAAPYGGNEPAPLDQHQDEVEAGVFRWLDLNAPVFRTRPRTPTVDLIRPGDVTQGAAGTCYALSAFKSMAATPEGRQLIFDSIRPLGNGMYEVTFPDQPDIHYRVSDDLLYREVNGKWVAVYASTGEVGWPALLEKAWAMRNSDLDSYQEIEGGHAWRVFQAFGLQTDGGSLAFHDLRDYSQDLDNPDSVSRPATLQTFVVQEAGSARISGSLLDATWDNLKVTNGHEISLRGHFVGSDGRTYFIVENTWANLGNPAYFGSDGAFHPSTQWNVPDHRDVGLPPNWATLSQNQFIVSAEEADDMFRGVTRAYVD